MEFGFSFIEIITKIKKTTTMAVEEEEGEEEEATRKDLDHPPD